MMILDRRQFLAAAGASIASAAAPKKKPNVLFIATDDMAPVLGCYGHPIVKTPNLDRLAKRGVRFTHAYTQFALCSPSRSSLMTGLAPDTTKVKDLKTHFREAIPDVVTISQCFQKNGYFAARAGKIYHYNNPSDVGTNGLDDEPSWNQRINPKGVDKSEEDKCINHTPQRKSLGSAIAFYASPAPDEQHTDGMVATAIIKLMEQHKNEPFFLAAGFFRPHTPYISPKKYFDLYPPETLTAYQMIDGEMEIAPPWAYFTKPANWDMTEQQQREALQAYYASVTFTDANVGRLLDALDRLGLTDNTVIVFWSDHGYSLGEHGQWLKQTVFESAGRIPLIFAGPGIKAKGKASSRTIEMLDFYPTLVDLCGLSGVPSNLHGKSLRPLLDNPAAPWDRPAISQMRRLATPQLKAASGAAWVDGYSIRTERYRFTEWADGAEGAELYDYQTDPNELKNLAQDPAHATLRTQLQTKLRAVSQSRGRV